MIIKRVSLSGLTVFHYTHFGDCTRYNHIGLLLLLGAGRKENKIKASYTCHQTPESRKYTAIMGRWYTPISVFFLFLGVLRLGLSSWRLTGAGHAHTPCLHWKKGAKVKTVWEVDTGIEYRQWIVLCEDVCRSISSNVSQFRAPWSSPLHQFYIP